MGRSASRSSSQIQAAISAVHCRADRFEDTDWEEIVRLYDALLDLAPSVVIRLNRAVAISRVEGPAKGLAMVDALAGERAIADRHAYYAVRAGLLEELERWDEARGAFLEARNRTENMSEIRYFEEKIRELERNLEGSVGK